MTRPRLWLAFLLLAAAAVIAAVVWHHPRPAPAPPDDDPRLTYDTPYRNAHPGVAYVGDEECGQCHVAEAAAYARHPMALSLSPAGDMKPVERYGEDANNPFRQLGFQFRAERRGGRLIHRETGRGRDGAEIDLEHDVAYAVGSGTRGRTYLLDKDGTLFQSPISWYAEKGIWDLTPGFDVAEHFERPARVDCLFCHSNRVEPVAHTVSRYERPVFRGHGIGCERCHGPGELHVKRRTSGETAEGLDDTIVNPSRLAPGLRDAVCEQCHLQGEVRVTRRGRALFDYRPGLPLSLFVSVFQRKPEFAAGPTVGGHADQMKASRCYQGSGGKLGCVSCHDPHAVPAPETKAAHYRGRCLTCHTEASCVLPFPERRRRNAADSCIDCHMPRAESRIAHTAIANHRVVRKPEKTPGPAASPPPLRPGAVPLVPFHDDPNGTPDAEASRDLGVALAHVGMKYPGMGEVVASGALPMLEAGLVARPDDVAAWEAKGTMMWRPNRRDEALTAFETALKAAPTRELTLSYAGVLASSLGKRDEAVGYWRRALAVNPLCSQYHYRVARLLAEREEWGAALEACEAALRLNPFHEETRSLRETCRRRAGSR